MANYPMFLFDLRCSGSAGYLVTTYSWHSYWWIPPVSSEPSGPCQVWLQNNEDFSDSLLPSRNRPELPLIPQLALPPTECDHGNIPATKHRRFSSNWKLGNNGSDFSNIICDLKCYSPSILILVVQHHLKWPLRVLPFTFLRTNSTVENVYGWTHNNNKDLSFK